MFNVNSTASVTDNVDHRGAADTSEKNRDQFRYLFISRLMIASATSFIAVFGFAFSQGGGAGVSTFFIWPLWMLFLSLLTSLLAALATTGAYVLEAEGNKLLGNASSKLNAGFNLAKKREDVEMFVDIGKSFSKIYGDIPALSVHLKNYDLEIEKCAEAHFEIGREGLINKANAKRVFKFANFAGWISIISLLAAFLIPLAIVSFN